jgi:hypothetical protein
MLTGILLTSQYRKQSRFLTLLPKQITYSSVDGPSCHYNSGPKCWRLSSGNAAPVRKRHLQRRFAGVKLHCTIFQSVGVRVCNSSYTIFLRRKIPSSDWTKRWIGYKVVNDYVFLLLVCLFSAQQPLVGQGLLIHAVSRSRTTTHHSR